MIQTLAPLTRIVRSSTAATAVACLLCAGLAISPKPASAQNEATSGTTGSQVAVDAFNAGVAAYNSNDKTTARKQFQRACDEGLALGCHNVGLLLEQTDEDAAITAYQRACDGTYAMGCKKLGDMLAVQGRTAAALVAMERACTGGETSGCYNVGFLLYRSGDVAGARDAFQRTCDMGNQFGCNDFAILLKSGKGGPVTDKAAARKTLKKACDLKINAACTMTVP